MNPLANQLYAVIQTMYSNGESERFVVAYASTRSLKNFIATERIVVSGFRSRSEATDFVRSTGMYSALRCRLSHRVHLVRHFLTSAAHSMVAVITWQNSAGLTFGVKGTK